MKRLFLAAISVLMVVSMSAQPRNGHQMPPAEGPRGQQMPMVDQRVEQEIEKWTRELVVNDRKAEKFASTYREYAAKRNDAMRDLREAEMGDSYKKQLAQQKKLISLQEKFYGKFRKSLNEKQVEKLLKHDMEMRTHRMDTRFDRRHQHKH